MSRLLFEHLSFENLESLSDINLGISIFCETITKSLEHGVSQSVYSSLSNHNFNFGNFFNDLTYEAYPNILNNKFLEKIEQRTHQELTNIFYAYPNGGKNYDTSKDFINDGAENYGFIGLFEYEVLNYPYIQTYLDLHQWQISIISKNPLLINWKMVKNKFFPNLPYSSFLLAKKVEANTKYNCEEVEERAKYYCDQFGANALNRGARMALAESLGKLIAESNYYIYDNALSQRESKIARSQRRIFKLQIAPNEYQYLSIDFEKCYCFEICDNNGKHLGEYRFDGLENGKNTADGTGKHNLISLK